MGVKGIGRYALMAAAVLLLVALGYRLWPKADSAGSATTEAAATPADASGWRAAGESAFQGGKYPDAVAAYRRVVALAPNDSDGWSALGEAQVQVDKNVSPTAIAAFRRTLSINPQDPRARYFMAVKRDLDGDHKGALADWQALLRSAPPGAPWASSVRDLIVKVAKEQRIAIGPLPAVTPPPGMPGAMGGAMGPAGAGAASAATDAIPGPNNAQLQDAARMSPTEQDQMARAMVDRLAARLADSPRDAPGWMRLMRSKVALGDQPGAKAALASGKAAFRGDAATTAQLDGAAKALGLE